MPAPTAPSIQLILHPERERYALGEPVRPKLELRNDGDGAAALGPGFVFDWEHLAFAAPGAVELIGPDGADLMQPYRDAPAPGLDRPIRVAPRASEWLPLPIYAHVHLRDPGAYTLAVALADERGAIHRSNRLGFTLTAIDPPRPGPARITLAPAHQELAPGAAVVLEVTFHNQAAVPMTFLRPQEDSLDGWANPSYVFTVTDAAGRALARPLRTGSMAEPRDDAAARSTVVAGASSSMWVTLPTFPGLARAGDYRVRLTYLVRDQAIGKAGVVLPDRMAWSPDVLVGRIESDDVTVTVR